MARLPHFSLAPLALAALLGCGEPADGDPEDPGAGAPAARLPFVESPLPEERFQLVSDIGDTLEFAVTSTDDLTRLARYRRVAGGVDSLVAVIHARTKSPVQSVQRIHSATGSLLAGIEYGRGFDGQARLILSSSRGEQRDNIRTPPPILDAAQLPLTLKALRSSAPDSFSFNYVAPFERKALAARIDSRETVLATPGGEVPAREIHLRVSGLEERYWFEPSSPHRLLQLQEVTRNVTWSRPSVPAAAGSGR